MARVQPLEAPCKNEVISPGQWLLDLRLPGEESLPFVPSSSGPPQCPPEAQLSRERLSGRDALIHPQSSQNTRRVMGACRKRPRLPRCPAPR